MKKLLSLMAAMLLVVSLAACQSESDTDGESVSPPASSQTSNEETPESVPEPSVEPEIPQDTESEPAEPDQRQVLMTIDGQSYEITLYENPVADALYDMLPLEVTFEDYNSVEKIAYLPEGQQLPSADELEGYDPSPGDLCLYAPWGNLSLFYQDFNYSNGLISLGRLEAGIEDIAAQAENFTVTLEKSE
ncbi:cyclophilin-like fold protein [Lachnotalea sp. AF33-28]|uniref:cyclophilin-like fold protein n=1 Tax=Lachnotalea sp. AF33-28 TaxID=2292046 RepID=UPI000E4AB464|nr:cyclophilin-like fold protein [Lachnotalea sp. AF33-28]RHP30980.1 hypothetical protein DWZ56_17455 [Lachnotalea sp. AF33-28]